MKPVLNGKTSINKMRLSVEILDSSVNVYTNYAWRYFYKNDLKTAMKRFNQSWLLNPEYPDSCF